MALGTFSGGGLGFGVAFSLYDDFSQTASEIERSMGRLDAYTEELQRRMDTSMNQMAVGAAMVAVGVAGMIPIGYGVKVAAEFETALVGLETFLGSAERAREVFEGIQEDAARTPFGLQGILAANRILISTGMAAEEVREDVFNLVNAIAAVGGSNDELQRMAFNLLQIRNQGKAMGIDIRQFAMAGIDIYGLLADSLGKTAAEVKDMDITYDMLTQAFAKAAAEGGKYAGAAERLEATLSGTWEKLRDNLQFTAATIGEQVLPLAHQLLEVFIDWSAALREFVQTPLGSWMVRAWTVTSIALIAFGGLLIVINLLRVGLFQMANAFGVETRAKILSTIASRGAVAGFRAMAAAAWASLGPYAAIAAAVLAYVYVLRQMSDWLVNGTERMRTFAGIVLFLMGPLGRIVAFFVSLNKGFKDFDALVDGTGQKLSGFAGLFQRVAGIIRGVVQVWNSWNSETQEWEFPVALEEALDALGIRETVVAIGTWLVRLKELFRGVWVGINEGIDVVMRFGRAILDSLSTAADWLDEIGIHIGRNRTDLERWAQIGRYVGYALIAVLSALTLAFAAMAAASLIALAPLIVALSVIYGIIKAIVWTASKIGNAVSGIAGLFGGGEPKNGMTPTDFSLAPLPTDNGNDGGGSDKPAWSQFSMDSWWPQTESKTNPVGQDMPEATGTSRGLDTGARITGQQYIPMAPTVVREKNTEVKNITMKVDLDSVPIAEKVLDVMDLNSGREN